MELRCTMTQKARDRVVWFVVESNLLSYGKGFCLVKLCLLRLKKILRF